MINLKRLVKINIDVEKTKEKYVFEIILQDKQSHLFKVKREEDRSQWVDALVKQVNKLRENQSILVYVERLYCSLESIKESKIQLFNKSVSLAGLLSLKQSRGLILQFKVK